MKNYIVTLLLVLAISPSLYAKKKELTCFELLQEYRDELNPPELTYNESLLLLREKTHQLTDKILETKGIRFLIDPKLAQFLYDRQRRQVRNIEAAIADLEKLMLAYIDAIYRHMFDEDLRKQFALVLKVDGERAYIKVYKNGRPTRLENPLEEEF